MEIKQIIFPEVNKVEIVTKNEELKPGSVCVRTMVSTVSPGTERANITGDLNVSASTEPPKEAVFPRVSGYSSAGIVEAVGECVKDFKVGDRVALYWSLHKDYNIVARNQVVKIPSEDISYNEAALSFISTFPMAAIRKTRLEMGESALVMGLGTLGQIAVRLLKASGATPIIAADPIKEKRDAALRGGADYALDPLSEGFAEKVKELTGGGAKVAIEVTGVGAGLSGALDCMAGFGRVALLGCTRDKNFTIDYYRKVHAPGISLIGAHTIARPEYESSPGMFTHRDDMTAVLNLLKYKRISFDDMLGEVYSPADCEKVYDRLINDKNFPAVVQFDWRLL